MKPSKTSLKEIAKNQIIASGEACIVGMKFDYYTMQYVSVGYTVVKCMSQYESKVDILSKKAKSIELFIRPVNF